MELDHLVLADIASQRPDGKLDLYGVGWDTINTTAVPASHPRMDVVVRFLLSQHELESSHHVVVALVGSDGQELAKVDGEVAPLPPEEQANVPAGRKVGLGLLLTFSGIVFPEYGSYQLVVTWDGTEARQPMRLYVAPVPGERRLAA